MKNLIRPRFICVEFGMATSIFLRQKQSEWLVSLLNEKIWKAHTVKYMKIFQ